MLRYLLPFQAVATLSRILLSSSAAPPPRRRAASLRQPNRSSSVRRRDRPKQTGIALTAAAAKYKRWVEDAPSSMIPKSRESISGLRIVLGRLISEIIAFLRFEGKRTCRNRPLWILSLSIDRFAFACHNLKIATSPKTMSETL